MTSQELLQSLSFSSFIKLTLSGKKEKTQTLQRVVVVPKLIQNQPTYQFTFYNEKKVLHKNVDVDSFYQELQPYFANFKQGLVKLVHAEYHLFFNKEKEQILKKEAQHIQPSLLHNSEKNYILKEGEPILFFQELNIMDARGRVFPSKYNKFRQINRYLEFIRDVLPLFPKEKRLKVVDFGCGKSYLTFAAYHYLHTLLGYEVDMIGLDLKKDVIQFCNQTAAKCQMESLSFEVGDIASYDKLNQADLVFSLHACDVATDYALAKAVEAQAKVIMAVPCCQHEFNDQIKSKTLPFLLEQGIIKERMSALITDVARLQLLGAVGYKAQIIEFIETEHTPKNLLIRAILQDNNRLLHWQQYQQLKQEYGFKHTLEQLLKEQIKA